MRVASHCRSVAAVGSTDEVPRIDVGVTRLRSQEGYRSMGIAPMTLKIASVRKAPRMIVLDCRRSEV